MPKINSLEVVHQDTNKDSYQNLHDILVALNKSLALEKEVVDEDARASIENLLEMYANDKEAFLRSVQTLTAKFKNSEAIFSEEILLRASEIEALAKRISSLSATVDNANAAIYEESYARATADEALASDITTVSATLGSKNRTYYQTNAPTTSELVAGDLWIDLDDNKLYRYNGTSWDNVQDDQIGVNTAAITNEEIARVDADSALAIDINAVTARLDTGDFATVKQQAEASVTKNRVYFQPSQPSGGTYVVGDLWIDSDDSNKTYTYTGSSWVLADPATLRTYSQASPPVAPSIGDIWVETDNNNQMFRWNGSYWVDISDGRITQIEAKWGVEVDAGGRVAGIQLNSSNTGSSNFIVLADNFKVYRSGYTSDPIFATGTVNGVATVGIKGNLVVDGSIITSGVANNAITQSGSANGTYSAYAYFTLGVSASVYVLGVFTQGSGRNGLPVGLYIDGVQQTSEQPQEGTVASMATVTTLGAGSHSVSIGAYSNTGDMRCNVMFLVMKK